MKFRCISGHAEDLADGRVVGPGEEIELSEEDLKEDHNERLFAEGMLIAIDEDGESEAKKASTRGKRDVTKQQDDLAPPEPPNEDEGGKK